MVEERDVNILIVTKVPNHLLHFAVLMVVVEDVDIQIV